MIAAVVTGLTTAAHGEDLVIPYGCSVDHNQVHVSPASKTSYRILGHRDEQPFVDCSAPGHCRTLMIHRFKIACGRRLRGFFGRLSQRVSVAPGYTKKPASTDKPRLTSCDQSYAKP